MIALALSTEHAGAYQRLLVGDDPAESGEHSAAVELRTDRHNEDSQ